MAKYSAELNELVNNGVSLFDFTYPIFDEAYRAILEKKIIRHYYFYEIGTETVGRFKYMLNTKLNEIMPYYNKIYLAFNDEIKIKSNMSISSITNNEQESSNTIVVNTNDSVAQVHRETDTPQTRLDLDGSEHFSLITDNNNTMESDIFTDNAGTVKSDNVNNQSGYSNITEIELLNKYRQGLINIDMMVIKELAPLFMLVF